MARGALIARGGVYILTAGACLFLSAGRADLPFFWAYLIVLAALFAASFLFIDPELTKERLRPGGRKPGRALSLLIVPSLAHWIVAGLDAGRYRWTPPLYPTLQLLALLLVAASFALSVWAMHVNRFFSSVVRIQTERGHTVVTNGPYAWIRHPGYAATLLHVLVSGPALGSLVAILPHLLLVPFLAYRIVTEDRVLRRELPGYADYAERVRYRVLPGIW